MAKIKIITFGCSNNVAESEIMAGLLKKAGHKIVESNEDLTIINLCTVKGPSLNKGINAAAKVKTRLIFAGCIPKHAINKLLAIKKNVSIINTHNLEKITTVVNKTLEGKQEIVLAEKKKIKLCMPRLRKNSNIAIIPISSGCVSSCSYCAVKNVKGNLMSYPAAAIIKEIKNGLSDGCKEIWLTAQDTGCYGMDIKTSLTELLHNVSKIKQKFYVRLGMANPSFIYKQLNELVEVFKNDKIFKFLHLPLQSGSDKVLKNMNRNYNVKQFLSIVSKFREEIPGVTIATDIIVGYPTETEQDFKKTVDIIKKIKPEVLNLNRFWRMPGTKSEHLKPLPSEVLKKRSLIVHKLHKEIALAQNKKWINWVGEVLVDETGRGKSFIARNFAYKPIVIKDNVKLGAFVKVKVYSYTEHYLKAKTV